MLGESYLLQGCSRYILKHQPNKFHTYIFLSRTAEMWNKLPSGIFQQTKSKVKKYLTGRVTPSLSIPKYSLLHFLIFLSIHLLTSHCYVITLCLVVGNLALFRIKKNIRILVILVKITEIQWWTECMHKL